jgi:hypothetical protein
MKKSLFNPINYWRVGTLTQRRLALALLLLARLPRIGYRFLIYALFCRKPQSTLKPYLVQLRQNGFVRIPRGVLPVDAVLAECDAMLRSRLADASGGINSKKSYLVPLLSDDDYATTTALMDFATSEEVVFLVSAYLHSLPVLTYLNLWYSPNRVTEKLEGSQLWHLDHESYRQVKMFLYVNDVDETCGPTKAFPKRYSKLKQKELGYRLGDGKHFSEGLDDARSVVLTGKRGDIVLLDTSTCFHRGSDGLGSPRYVCTAQYLPIYAYSKNKFINLCHLSASAGPSYRKRLFYG